MAIFPFVFVQKKEYKADKLLVHHEKIHLMQQLELLILPFYIIYFLNYLFNVFRFRAHSRAYMNIVFEREAYFMENVDNYFRTRKIWNWLEFLTV